MIENYRMVVVVLVVAVLALANGVCCGTATNGNSIETTAIVSTEDPADAESSPLAGEPPAEPPLTPTLPVPTVDVSGCTLGATFVEDVTIPDNTPIDAGKSFVKTWSIHNTGTCDWGSGYRLTFVGGDQMGSSKSSRVPETTAGAASEVSVELVAPGEPGTYYGEWRICVNDMDCFGDTFYVQIISRSIPIPPDSEAMIDCLKCAKAYPYLLNLRSEPGTESGQ